MEKIERLTPEQEAYLPKFRAEYLKAATGGGRADRQQLEEAIADAYQVIGKLKPRVIILQSPLQAMMAIKLMQTLVSKDLGDQLRDQLGYQLRAQLRAQPIYNSHYLWGAQDLFWIAFFKFAQHIGIIFTEDQSSRLELMRRIGFQCEWWWPYEEICFASEKPISTKWDERRLLHNENGPSVEYEGGYALYSWHGINISDVWIKDKTSLTPSIALSQTNAELRRAACEIIGWDKVLDDSALNPVVIDKDQPHIGELIQVDLPDAPEQWFLRYKCGTGRVFAEPVNDKSFNTALKANAGGNGWRGVGDPESFIPFIRT